MTERDCFLLVPECADIEEDPISVLFVIPPEFVRAWQSSQDHQPQEVA